jgi:mono/diheme cytochrome c family protein
MRYFIGGIVAIFIATAAWFLLLPRLNWGAAQKPGMIEQAMANDILGRWIKAHANSSANPFSPTQPNLKAASAQYGEHCAACHALDGSGRNRFEAEFYPPVAKLTGDVQKLSDPEIYFIVANGIRNTAMPAFGEKHSAEDMWRAVLWVRHLANLTPSEQREIKQQVRHATMKHETTMERGMGPTLAQ